jgi:hypothetical protein
MRWLLAAVLLSAYLLAGGQVKGGPDVAAWRTEPATQDGIRLLSGADGVTAQSTRGGSRCVTTAPGNTPSLYLYFNLDDGRTRGLPGPLYVRIEYFDEALGGGLKLEYDSAAGETPAAKYTPAEDQAGGWQAGTKRWMKAAFLLQRPRFANRQNLDADFRLRGGPLFVRAVIVSRTRPADWDILAKIDTRDVKPLVKIGQGGQLIVGGFDPTSRADAARYVRTLEASIPALKALGVTSHEAYVRWNLCEPAEGQYDWSVYDQYVTLYKRHGLKWVPFLICGSAYSLPDWYYKKPGSQGYVCLEHGTESDVQSLWNPALRGHVARFIRAFCERYRDSGVVESILLGVTGNYGEAIYPASGNDWTADVHGKYHTHAGFWAGDKYAEHSFQVWLISKYGGSDRLRDAWGHSFQSVDHVKPFLRRDSPNERAWLDFCDWYTDSMTNWSRFWLQKTRRHFPRGDIYLCTGGHAPPEHGASFAQQCKAAAEVGAGVRITNEASDYAANFTLTRWVASAGRQYGAYFSFEPAGGVDANGVTARIYNATASGARGLHYYYPNLFDTPAARESFVRYGGQFKQRTPVTEIAVYYPQTYIKLHGNTFMDYARPLRDRFDFAFMSDEQIADGGLKEVKALILLDGNTSEERTWDAIIDWVKGGGVLFYADGMGRLRNVEGNEGVHDRLFGPNAAIGKGRAFVFAGSGKNTEYRAFICAALAGAKQLSENTRAMVTADGKEDGLFVTLCEPGELLWLNSTKQAVQKGSTTVPPFGIASQRLR